MNTQPPDIPNEIVDYLAQKGAMRRIEQARQAEVEDERRQLFARVSALKAEAANELPPIRARIDAARQAVDTAAQSLADARAELAAAETAAREADRDPQITQLQNRLRALADPKIARAHRQLIDWIDDARQQGLATWTTAEKAWDMTRLIRTEHSNADQVQTVIAHLRDMADDLDALRAKPRPDDLDAHLERVMEAAKEACRSVGVTVTREVFKELVH